MRILNQIRHFKVFSLRTRAWTPPAMPGPVRPTRPIPPPPPIGLPCSECNKKPRMQGDWLCLGCARQHRYAGHNGPPPPDDWPKPVIPPPPRWIRPAFDRVAREIGDAAGKTAFRAVLQAGNPSIPPHLKAFDPAWVNSLTDEELQEAIEQIETDGLIRDIIGPPDEVKGD